MTTKKVAKILNVKQFLIADGLEKTTYEGYYDKIKRVVSGMNGKTYDKWHPVPIKDAVAVLKHFKEVEKVISNMFPLTGNDDPADTRKNVENQKGYYVAIRTLTRDGKLSEIGSETEELYNKKMLELRDTSQENRDELRPTTNMSKYPELNWDEIIKRRNMFWNSKVKTLNNLRAYCLISLYTCIPPRRLEYYAMKVYFKNHPQQTTGINYIVLKTDGSIEMSLDAFKTRKRTFKKKTKDILPTYKKTLPDDLAKSIKEYVKKAQLRDGDYLFTKTKGANTGQPYTSPTFSLFLNKVSQDVIKASIGVDDYRHWYITKIAENYLDYDKKELKEIAHSMGDLSVETNMSYRVIVEKKQQEPQEQQEQEGEAPLEEPPAVIMEEEPPAPQQQEERGVGDILDDLYKASRPFLIEMFEYFKKN